MDGLERKALDRRLARIEGQVRGIRRLLDENAYCCDVLTQLSAVTSALDQVAAKVAAEHIKHCIVGHDSAEAHPTAKAMTREEVLDELEEVLQRLKR